LENLPWNRIAETTRNIFIALVLILLISVSVLTLMAIPMIIGGGALSGGRGDEFMLVPPVCGIIEWLIWRRFNRRAGKIFAILLIFSTLFVFAIWPLFWPLDVAVVFGTVAWIIRRRQKMRISHLTEMDSTNPVNTCCRNCGAMMEIDSNFCDQCGNRIHSA
jgi:hypothetical protein